MPNPNKNKGKSWERDLAKHLITVFNLNFERVPSSGAFVGGKNSFRMQKLTAAQQLISTGDIIVPDGLDQFSIEAKFYSDFSFGSLLSEQNAQLDKWIAQGNTSNKMSLIVFKINRMGGFVCFNKEIGKSLQIPGNYFMYKDNYIVSIENFFEKNKENFLSLNKNPIKLSYEGTHKLTTGVGDTTAPASIN